jgi:gamma-glutamyltranspeptidase / glutathione hydrolase
MVASTHWLASAAGMAALERGGNAFDAAVTAGFVIQVVEPHMGGPGGEVPILLYDARRREARVVCGQGPAPRRATVAAFRELGLECVPGTGPLAACVPGAFDAWMLLLRDYGTLELRDVLAPAIGYAAGGYPLVAEIRETIAGVEQLFRDEWASSADVYLPGGELPRVGELFRNADLAATYRRVVADAEKSARTREGRIDAARGAFYRGWVAESIGSWVEATEVLDTSGRRHRGVLTADDLAGWQATYEPPVTLEHHGLTVCKTGPWGQGPVMLQQLALLQGFELEALRGADFVHTVVEAAKLAFADRDAWYGDPSFAEVPLDALLSPEYADRRRAQMGPSASRALQPGTAAGLKGRIPGVGGDHGDGAGAGEPLAAVLRRHGSSRHGGDTSHVDVVDRVGNMVSATPSGGWLSGAPVIPGLGFCLGTRAQMLWLDEEHPNGLAPGKRPRTTLTPTLVLQEGEPHLALGAPGGDSQDQWSLIALLRHLHHGQDLQQAIDDPMFRTGHLVHSFHPHERELGHLAVEARMEDDTVAELRRRGHDVTVVGPWELGRVCAVGREPSGVLKAAASSRGVRCYAVGR